MGYEREWWKGRDVRWVWRTEKGAFKRIKPGRDAKGRFTKRPATGFVEYVRTFVWSTEEKGVYYGVDVVEVEEVDLEDFSEDQANAGLIDPVRVRRMKRFLLDAEGLPADVRYTEPMETKTGGWRGKDLMRVGESLGPVGLRWEDLREVRR